LSFSHCLSPLVEKRENNKKNYWNLGGIIGGIRKTRQAAWIQGAGKIGFRDITGRFITRFP